MSETPRGSIPGDQMHDQPPPLESNNEGNHDGQVAHASWEAADEMKAAYEEWLERRGIDPASTPHLTMGRREFDVFRNAPPNYLGYVFDRYEIPQDDQANCQYALIDIEPEDPNQPPDPVLTIVTEADFGTLMGGREVIAKDFQQLDSDPNGPPTPESPAGALKTVNIANTLFESRQALQEFARELMRGQTTDPLSEHEGDIRIRAGGLMPGQQDAYVWTVAPFANAVALTLNNPSRYDSVCVVRGQEREAANGKVGMAQIINPQEVLKIEGENLERLQSIYRDMYSQPDFALTELQRRERDELFNGYVKGLISEQARLNSEREQIRQSDEIRRRRQQQQPQLRARQIPHS